MKKWLKLSLISFLLLYCAAAFASSNYTIDLYRSAQITATKIQKKYDHELSLIANIILSKDVDRDPKYRTIALTNMQKIKSGINDMGEFLYVNIAPIFYQNDKILHFTVEIVDKKDKSRLEHFMPSPTESIKDPNHLIEKMQEYMQIGFDIVAKEKFFPTFKSCPAFHCTFGFDDPRLKKYKAIFDKVPKYKNQLINVLRKDQDGEKRSAAVFLLAHLKNPQEIVDILSDSIYDPYSEVRNNVMRVVSMTISKAHTIKHVPLAAVVSALDFPTTTDRNKALMVIYALVQKYSDISYIKSHVANILVENLRLTQPNIVGPSHRILEIISGKKYAKYDYAAWRHWLEGNSGA